MLFFHFLVYRRRGSPRFLPPGTHRAVVAGRHGRLRPAGGYGLRGTSKFYWANHVWFAWREGGEPYVASLHYFGPGTRALLGRLIAELRPASDL